MKELRFRAWDGKKMIEDAIPTSETSIVELFEYEHQVAEVEAVEQYTGLKDKNGKEIYEGDILTHKDYWWIKIEYDNGAFIARDIQSTKCNNRIIKGYISNFNISKWKVIGNIYEDKELISQE